jgi:Dimerisation domain
MNPSKSPNEHVIDIALGYILSRSLHVATELGIADLLQDGAPKTIEEISSSTCAHPKSLYRLLRTLEPTLK